MTDDDWTRLARRMSEISEAPLYIDDSPNLTMMEIRAKARRLAPESRAATDRARLPAADDLRQEGRVTPAGGLRVLPPDQAFGQGTEVPVVAMSQLNRGPEQRTDKKPMLADLRESGSIEQDADVVILLHRPDAFESDDPAAVKPI